MDPFPQEADKSVQLFANAGAFIFTHGGEKRQRVKQRPQVKHSMTLLLTWFPNFLGTEVGSGELFGM